MNKICKEVQTQNFWNVDWGEALSAYIAMNTSQSYVDQLNQQGKIAQALSDGKLGLRELLWQSNGGLGLFDPQHWLNLGGNAQALLEDITFSKAYVEKRQFMQGLKRWCIQASETLEK